MPGLDTSRTPIGLYSGDAAGIAARESQISGLRGITVTRLPSWDFAVASMGASLPSSWTNPQRGFFSPNIHCRIGGTHLPWLAAAGGAQDSQLIATLQSIRNVTQAWTVPVYITAQEEHDGADGAANHAAGRTQAQAVSDYRAWANHVKALAAVHCPGALVGQVVADVSRLPTWFWPEADFYGSDPHFYGWNANGTPSGGTFAQRMNTVISVMTSLGIIGNKPWSMHVGGVERVGDPAAKAGYISGMGATLETAPVVPDWVTWWDRSGNVNGSTADERIDTTPQSLAAFAALYGLDAPPPPPPPPDPVHRSSGVITPRRKLLLIEALTPPPAPQPDIDVVMLEDGSNNANQNSYVTGTVTPTIADGEFLVFVAHQVASGTPNVPNMVSGNDLGLTWTVEQVAANTTMALHLMRASFSGGAPTPDTLEVDFTVAATPQQQTIMQWSVLQIENPEIGDEIAEADPLVGSGVSIVTHSLSGPALGATGNRVILGTYYEANELAQETWATTLTRLSDSTPISGLMVAWDPAAYDGAPFTDWTTNARYRSIAVEVRKRTV